MRRMILASTAVVAVLVLSGCAQAGGSSQSADGPVMVEPAPGARDGGVSSAEGGSSAVDSAAVDQSVITTGWITVTVDDPTAAVDATVDLVESLDGRIDSRSQQAGSDESRSSAQLVIRVPADSVDAAIEGLQELGTVDSVSLSSNDVTLQVRDLDAQIKALQASVDRLLDLVDQAATTADLVELETAISDRQAQLDSLKSQKQYLSDQIAYSTLTVDLTEKGALPSSAPGDFWSGLATGWASLVAAMSGLVVMIGVLLPWLLPLAVIAAVCVLIVGLSRRGARRRAARAGAAGAGGAGSGGAIPTYVTAPQPSAYSAQTPATAAPAAPQSYGSPAVAADATADTSRTADTAVLDDPATGSSPAEADSAHPGTAHPATGDSEPDHPEGRGTPPYPGS
ncbi:DUF4349 domain-containing protein [Herbiconiux sp. A18JL235]|uniref:DUF4349 domain-containing protein n=1 Tax=Herbiconiux sp. A18JL235 TaxID=3152363 RepID=A0AB39BDS1_9MICO